MEPNSPLSNINWEWSISLETRASSREIRSSPGEFEPIIDFADADLKTEHEGNSREEEELIYHYLLPYYDPAIFLDRYVLTGWGPEEIEAEEKRRSAEQYNETEMAIAYSVAMWLYPAVVPLISTATEPICNRKWP